MSIYIGKNGSDNLLHVTSDTSSVNTLLSGPNDSTVFHSDFDYLHVTYKEELGAYYPYLDNGNYLPVGSFYINNSLKTLMQNNIYSIVVTAEFTYYDNTKDIVTSVKRQYNISHNNVLKKDSQYAFGPFTHTFMPTQTVTTDYNHPNWTSGTATEVQNYFHIGKQDVFTDYSADSYGSLPLPEWGISGSRGRLGGTPYNITAVVYIFNVSVSGSTLRYNPVDTSGSIKITDSEFSIGELDINNFNYLSKCGGGTILPYESPDLSSFKYLGSGLDGVGHHDNGNDLFLMCEAPNTFLELSNKAPVARVLNNPVEFSLYEIVGTDAPPLEYQFLLEQNKVWKNTINGKSYIIDGDHTYQGLAAKDTTPLNITIPTYSNESYATSYINPNVPSTTIYVWDGNPTVSLGSKEVVGESIIMYAVFDPSSEIVAQGVFSAPNGVYTKYIYEEAVCLGVNTSIGISVSGNVLTLFRVSAGSQNDDLCPNAPEQVPNLSDYKIGVLAI